MGLMREYPIAWQTTGVAVPILSKVKVLPRIPQANGQLFLKSELVTPSWDASLQLRLTQEKGLNSMKTD